MAFPASQIMLKNALDSVAINATRIKGEVDSMNARSAAGDVPREDFWNLQQRLQHTIDVWDVNAQVPGLVQYAKDQYNDPALDIVAEYNAMRAAAITLRDWIFGAIPTAAQDGAARLRIIDTQGNETPIMVTTAQSANFRTEAAAFSATIS